MAYLINSFKSRLDKFWLLHDFVYDYRAVEEHAVIDTSCNLLSFLTEKSDMSALECGVVASEDPTVNPFFTACHDDLDSIFAEQDEIGKEVKLSCLLQLDDTFTTEDRWPI